MDLQHYNTASSIKEEIHNGQFFARVTTGDRQGSIGRIIDVKSPYYSQHFYRLAIKGKKPFWIKASKLEFLQDWSGDTIYNKIAQTPAYKDMMGREIQIGQTLSFPRLITSGSVEMIMGTVRRISSSGAIYVKPFLNSDAEEMTESEIRVGTPNRAMILDRDTVNQVMLSKMSMAR